MPEQPRAIAPVYRYYTADLLTDEILEEIPFRGVSWERVLKGAGKFSGSIPVVTDTDSIGLHDATSPGRTALYVVRNGVCVWGGIIWSRQYSANSRSLNVSASEFPSYFYHRRLWKTWNHQFGATISWVGNDALTWIESRRNWARNPDALSTGNLADWGHRWNWTPSFFTSGGLSNGRYIRLTSVSGQTFPRTTYGIDIFGNADITPSGYEGFQAFPVEAGEFAALSVYVRPSYSAPGKLWYRISDGAGTWLTGKTLMSATPAALPAGVWSRLEGVVSVPATGFMVFGAYTDTSADIPVGSTLDFARLLVEKSSTVESWFYGASATADEDYRYSWEGDVGSSNSVLKYRVGVPGFRALFDNGSDVLVRPGSTVKLEFDSPDNVRYNGQYRVASEPAPTKDGFALLGGASVADLTKMQSSGLWDYYYTQENHGYNTGDVVQIRITKNKSGVLPSPQILNVTVDAHHGSESSVFRVKRSTTLNTGYEIIDGEASRPLPAGIYRSTTVTVRQDTYDYIRTLIDAMFADFVGVDFPNVYLEPGMSTNFSVVQKEAYDGHRIIKTAEPHGVAPGQAVQISNVDSLFNGEYEVTDAPTPTTLVYAGGGAVPITAVSDRSAVISSVGMTQGLARVATVSAHGFLVGQKVTVSVGDPYGEFSGTWDIYDVPSPTIFRYRVVGKSSYANSALPDAKASVGAVSNAVLRTGVGSSGLVTLELRNEPTFAVGQSLVVSGVNRTLELKEKALDAQNALATVQTAEPHGFSVGDTVTLSGLTDTASGTSRRATNTSTTITTERPHNFRRGDVVSIEGRDVHKMVEYQVTNNVATVYFDSTHSIPTGASVLIENLFDEVGVLSTSLTSGVGFVRTTTNHNFSVNDSVLIEGLNDTYAVASREVVSGTVIITTQRPHNIQAGQKVTVSGMGVPFDAFEMEVDEATATRIVYKIDQKYWDGKVEEYARRGQKLSVPMNVPQAKASGTIISHSGYFNGTFIITSKTSNTFTFWRPGNNMPLTLVPGRKSKITGSSQLNGTRTVTSRGSNTVSFTLNAPNLPRRAVPVIEDEEIPKATLSLESLSRGSRTLTAVTASTVTFNQSLVASSSTKTQLQITKASIFNGNRVITSTPSSDRFQFSLPGYTGSVLEEATNNKGHVVSGIYNGTYTITSVDKVLKTVSYLRTGAKPFGSRGVLTRGFSSANPVVIVSTFGPYPGNAGLGIGYSSQRYTGVNVAPTSYRGFELKSVGEVLETYADTLNGFEYRIDCDYDSAANKFTKTFVLVPINFPEVAPGVSPASRFGADKIVFEYPGGSITEISLEESAENSANRFFAVGSTALGPDVGPDIGVATANDLLRGVGGRAWPLLDDSETIDGVEDKATLYGYAQRYLSEVAQPHPTLSVSVNGSIPPYVDSYVPGDWCSLIVKDKFIQMRLASELEPRDDILIRKIDSYQVTVPDGVTFPETVSLNLVAEWEVDTRG